ncbi:MAG: hypothetical protein ACTSW1_17635 [Candidatus Hodarchaeales archaeon]
MKSFPNNLKFRFPWRKYQRRLLDELDQYLELYKVVRSYCVPGPKVYQHPLSRRLNAYQAGNDNIGA